jgi:hypothetical protein
MTTVHGSDEEHKDSISTLAISMDQVSRAAKDDEDIICVTGSTGVYSPSLHQKLFGHSKSVQQLLRLPSPPESPPLHCIRSPTDLGITNKQQQKIDNVRFHDKKEKFADLVLEKVEEFMQIRNQHPSSLSLIL